MYVLYVLYVLYVYIYAYTLLTRLLTPAKCLCDCLSLLQGDYTAVENIFTVLK